MSVRTGCYLLLLLSLISIGAKAQGNQELANSKDTLLFHNGDRLTGAVSLVTEAEITFVTEFGVTLKIPRDKLKEVQIGRLPSSGATRSVLSSREGSSLSLQETPMPAAGMEDHAPDNTVKGTVSTQTKPQSADPAAPAPVRWLVLVEPQASLTAGTQKQQAFGGLLILNREQNADSSDWRHQTTRLVLDANNTLTSKPGASPVHVHVYDGTFGHQIHLTKNTHMFGSAEAYHNNSLRLYLQQSYGGGFGLRKVFDNGHQVVEASSDIRFFGQHFYPQAPSTTFVGARFSEGYTIQLAQTPSGPVELFEKASYVLPFDQRGAWQIRGTAGIRVPIGASFALKLQITDDYFQNVPNGRKNYSKTSLGISYTFKRPK